MALVFALLGILLLSMLAAALMLVTSAESQASFHYKSQTQATYAAMAGVQRTADWYRQVYGPWLNPVSGTPPAATNPPIGDTTYVWNVLPPTYNSNPVKLGDGANFPDSTKVTEFGDMRTTSPTNSASVGNATASYTIIDATLMSHERYKALDGVTDRIIEKWQVRVTGRVSSPLGDTVVQETAVLKIAPYAIFGDAIHGQCEVQMNGTIYTDSFYSPTGVYNTPPGTNVFTGADAGASVASNSFTGSSGSSGTINGDVVFGTSPDTGCSTSGSSVSGLTIAGDLEPAPSDPFPPITPTFTTSATKTDCMNKSSFESPAGSGIYHYPPNAPGSNNLGDCTLTGSKMLRLEVPDGNTPAAFYIRGIGVGSTNSNVAVVHASTGIQCSNLDPDPNKCAPVLLYVSTTLDLSGGGLLSAIMSPPPPQCDPTRFTIFYTGTADAHLGGTSGFCGTIYAPNATLEIAGNTQIWGAVTAKNVETGGGVEVHYDLALAKMRITVSPFRIINQGRKVY